MSPVLVAYLAALLLPLFVASWRTSVACLGAQGLLMTLIAHRLQPMPSTAVDWLTIVDLGLVRGIATPLAFSSVLRKATSGRRKEASAPDLLIWSLAFATLLASFTFGELLVPEAGAGRMLVAVACAAVLLGFLILATKADPLRQMMAALQIENAIALLELSGDRSVPPFEVHLALLCVFIATIGLFRWYLRIVYSDEATGHERPETNEGPTL